MSTDSPGPGPSKKRTKICFCRCRSHCTTYNSSKGIYEGPGKLHSRGTRDNHARDDRMLAARQHSTFPVNQHRTPGSRQHNIASSPLAALPHRAMDFTEIYIAEVEWLSTLPLANANNPFVFTHSPELNGGYSPSPVAALLRPNTGTHTLVRSSRANLAFLSIEHRLHNILGYIKPRPSSEESERLSDQIDQLWTRMCHEKEFQWENQRVGSGHYWSVNTG